MAGETIKTEGIALRIRPWSRTSHIVSWMTPLGKVTTVVKGANRSKSFFLGQYDLNYTCELLYYARAKGELHALKECYPIKTRDFLRENFRLIALSDYFRFLVYELSPHGEEATDWHSALESALEGLKGRAAGHELLSALLAFEEKILELAGLRPDFETFDKAKETLLFSIENGNYTSDEGRLLRVSARVARALISPSKEKNYEILLDAARVIGVFYSFQVDCARDVRRSLLELISNRKEKENEDETH